MYSIEKKGTKLVELEITGKIDSERMRSILDEFEVVLQGMEQVQLLYRLHDFEMPTTGAMMVKFGELPHLLKLMKRIDKIAILADKKWIQKVADFEGMLFPGIEIKGFGIEQDAQASAWLEG